MNVVKTKFVTMVRTRLDASGDVTARAALLSGSKNDGARAGRRVFIAAKRKFNGSLGPEDDKTGVALLKQAARMESIEAHEWLGYVYDYGYGTRPNRSLAFRHYLCRIPVLSDA